MPTTSRGYQLLSENGDSNHLPANESIQKFDDTANRVVSISLAAGNVEATQAQMMNAVLSLTGATAARELLIPDGQMFERKFVNTSAFAVTVKHAATTGAAVPAGAVKDLYSDGVTVKDGSTSGAGGAVSTNADLDVQLDVTGQAATITLTAEQALADFLYVIGTLAQDTTIEIPFTAPRSLFVSRATTGTFALRVKKVGAAGTGQLVNAGEFVAVRMVA